MNIEDLISQYIDGTLPSEAEAELHHRLAVSPEARGLFRAHIMLKGVARDQRVLHAPSPEMRTKLFSRLEREEGMVLPAPPEPAPSAQASAPVAPVPARSIPSELVKGKSARRRRRIVPWLIPIVIAGLMIAVLWNTGDREPGNIAGVKVEEVPAAPGAASGNPSSPLADHSGGAGPASDRDAAPAPAPRADAPASAATGTYGSSAGSVGSSVNNGLASRYPATASASGPVGNQDGIGGGNADGDDNEIAADRSTADVLAKEDAPVERLIPMRARSNQSGAANAEGSVVRNNKWAREEGTTIARNRHRATPDTEKALADSISYGGGYGAVRDLAAAERNDHIEMDNSFPSTPFSAQSDGSRIAPTTRQSSGKDAPSGRIENPEPVRREAASKPASTSSVALGDVSNERFGGKTVQQNLLSSTAADSVGFKQNNGSPQSMRPSPVMAAAPPPPSDMFGGAPVASSPAQSEALGEYKTESATAQTQAPRKDLALKAKTADEDQKSTVSTSSMEDSPLSPVATSRTRYMIGVQPSVVNIGSSNPDPQVTLTFATEFGGRHRLYVMGGMSGYREVGLDTVIRATSNGVPVTPIGPAAVRDTVGKLNEFWGGAGYRYTLRLAPRWNIGLGGWAGAGKRYYRVGSELPVTFDLTRSLAVELVPSFQYVHPFSGAGTTEETQIDLTLPYSEQRRRSRNPGGTGDFNFGVGMGILWSW